MMSDTDKKELEEYFSKQYLLIPKNRLYYMLGGMIVTAVTIVGLSYSSVLTMLQTDVANKARQSILQIEKEVTEAQQRIKKLERVAKSKTDWLHSTAVQESNAAKQRIAEVEQAGKEAAEKLAATTIESLQAKEVKIVDKDGKTKLLLAATAGNGSLSVYDSNDKERLRVAEDKNGCVGLWLMDHDGKYRMRLMMDPEESPLLYLNDRMNKRRLQLYEDKDGYAGLRLKDRDGNDRMILTTDSAGLPSLYLNDKKKESRLQLYEEESGDAGLRLTDRDGNDRMILMTDSAGLPSLYLNDRMKKKRLQLYEEESGYAGLALLDRNNTFRMKLITEPVTGLSAMEMYDKNENIIFTSQHLQHHSTISPASSAP